MCNSYIETSSQYTIDIYQGTGSNIPEEYLPANNLVSYKSGFWAINLLMFKILQTPIQRKRVSTSLVFMFDVLGYAHEW